MKQKENIEKKTAGRTIVIEGPANGEESPAKMRLGSVTGAYEVLRRAAMNKIEAVGDRIRISAALAELRPAAERHSRAVEDARETLKPSGYDRARAAVADGEAPTPLDLRRAEMKKADYDEALVRFIEENLCKEIEPVTVEMPRTLFDRLVQSNPGWNAEQLMCLMEVVKVKE